MDDAPHEYKESFGSCSACGNSPVNHVSEYISNTISTWTSTFQSVTGRRRPTTFVRGLDRCGALIGRGAAIASHALGIVRYGHDPSRALTYRSQVIWEEAQRRGIDMEQMFLFGKPTDIYRAKIRGGWTYFQSLPTPPEHPSDNAEWTDDKVLFIQELKANRIPAPRVRSVVSRREALEAFREFGASVVVKPRFGSRGRHTSTNVRTAGDLVKAFRLAKRLCRYVAVEEQLYGTVCRATLVAGELVGFFEAKRPSVTGDGRSTIAQLVHAKNAKKPERVQAIVLREENRMFLSRLGYTFYSVPPAGERVDLTHRVGRLFGAETRELLPSVHPELRMYLEAASRVAGLPVIGLDLIIGDPESDPDAQRWGIIEGNSLPFIDLHYLPLHGTPSNPAAAVWDLWGKDEGSKVVDKEQVLPVGADLFGEGDDARKFLAGDREGA